MERITPLAKILAEANGIEWQNLRGTGEGGMVVEQDILQYLSRIMSGEEEPPSTPVDAPPPDWNGEDLSGAMFNADMLKGAGVDADIAAFVEQTRPAAQPQPQVPTSFTSEPLTADEFELEDVPQVAQTQVAQTQVAQAQETQRPVPAPAPSAAPAASAAAGLGSLLSRLYKNDRAGDSPAPTAATPATGISEVAAPSIPAPSVSAPSIPAPAIETPKPAAPTVLPDVPAPVATPAARQPDFTPAPVAPAASAPAPVAPVNTAPIPAAPAPTAPASTVPATPIPGGQAAPSAATWFGVYLRRDADMRAAQDLAGQLGEALEQDVPLALLVARAAQRHAGLLGLGSVALDGGQGGQGARTVREGAIREVLGGLQSSVSGTPDLLVVDAAAHGLDDLHYPHTLTLSVGRVQGGRASLSLNGQADTAQAAQFLARVAETLEKPIVLVL